jgi:phage terminase large subunit
MSNTPILPANPTEKDIKEYVGYNIRERIILLDKCSVDEEFKFTTLELASRDPVFWINNFCWTYNPKFPLGCNDVPFVLYPFQEFFVREWVKTIEDQEDFVIEKSRDVGASWLLLLIFQWFWLFRDSVTFLVGSYAEQKVDKGGMDLQTLFGKLRYNLDKIPNWMKPEVYHTVKTFSIYDKQLYMENPERRSSITGQTGNHRFGRGDRYTAALFDELAYWEQATESWNGCQQSTNCRIALSTPNGEDNMFYKVAHWPGIELVQFPDAHKIADEKGLVEARVPY